MLLCLPSTYQSPPSYSSAMHWRISLHLFLFQLFLSSRIAIFKYSWCFLYFNPSWFKDGLASFNSYLELKQIRFNMIRNFIFEGAQIPQTPSTSYRWHPWLLVLRCSVTLPFWWSLRSSRAPAFYVLAVYELRYRKEFETWDRVFCMDAFSLFGWQRAYLAWLFLIFPSCCICSWSHHHSATSFLVVLAISQLLGLFPPLYTPSSLFGAGWVELAPTFEVCVWVRARSVYDSRPWPDLELNWD